METLQTKSKPSKITRYERTARLQDHGTRGNADHFRREVKRYDHDMKPEHSDKEVVADEVTAWLNDLSPEDRKYVLDGPDDEIDYEYLEAYGLTKDDGEYPTELEHIPSTPLHLSPEARDEIQTTRAQRREHLARAATLDFEKSEDDTHDYTDGMSIR